MCQSLNKPFHLPFAEKEENMNINEILLTVRDFLTESKVKPDKS